MTAAEHAHPPYFKVFAALTVLTLLEVGVAVWIDLFWLLAALLGLLAFLKAAAVALWYMHLRYEGAILWTVILLPVLLAVMMVAGFLPDAVGYH